MAREPQSRLVYSTGGEKPEPTPAAAESTASSSPGIRLRLDRRASSRIVTVVTGLPGTADEITALTKSLKAACGTGGTFKDGALELQGDHRTAVERHLKAKGLKSKRSGG